MKPMCAATGARELFPSALFSEQKALRNAVKHTHTHSLWVFIDRARYFSPILTKFGLSRQMIVEVPNIKFLKNSSSGSRADAWGQADRQTEREDEAYRRF